MSVKFLVPILIETKTLFSRKMSWRLIYNGQFNILVFSLADLYHKLHFDLFKYHNAIQLRGYGTEIV